MKDYFSKVFGAKTGRGLNGTQPTRDQSDDPMKTSNLNFRNKNIFKET